MTNTFKLYGREFKLAPQTATILRHLKQVGDISGVEAAALYRSRSLTKRMSEINEALYFAQANAFHAGTADKFPHEDPVVGQWSEDNTGQRYKRYVMPMELRSELTFS